MSFLRWRHGGRPVGYVRDGVYHVGRTVLGRVCRFSTGRRTQSEALVEYRKFMSSPVTYVSPLGMRPFAAAGSRQRPTAAADARRRGLNRKYRLTPEGYGELLEKQAGCCAICGRRAQDSTGKILSVDHDHETGRVRGLLCSHCNRGLGHFLDSEHLLRAAAAYLTEGPKEAGPRTRPARTMKGGSE